MSDTQADTRERETLDLEAIRKCLKDAEWRGLMMEDGSPNRICYEAVFEHIPALLAEVERLRSLAPGEARPHSAEVESLPQRWRDLAKAWAGDETRERVYTMVADQLETALTREPSQQNDGWRPSRERIALRVAAKLCDELNDEDIHGAAYDLYVARLGSDDGGDPSDDDYADAFLDIANRAMAPREQSGEEKGE